MVVPTFNERENVSELIARVDRALRGISWEMIFVDDDFDGTSAEIKAIGARDSRVRCIKRIGRRGLSSACIEGMLASAAPVFVVMDADRSTTKARSRRCDRAARGRSGAVIASRYTSGGAIGEDKTRPHERHRDAPQPRRVPAAISDPMSGFFMITAEALDGCAPAVGQGVKILLDIVASRPRSCAWQKCRTRSGSACTARASSIAW